MRLDGRVRVESWSSGRSGRGGDSRIPGRKLWESSIPEWTRRRNSSFPVPGREFKEETCRVTSLSNSLDHAGGGPGRRPGLHCRCHHAGRWPDEPFQYLEYRDRVARIYPDDDPGHLGGLGQPARAGLGGEHTADPGRGRARLDRATVEHQHLGRFRSSTTRPSTISTTRRSSRSRSATTRTTARPITTQALGLSFYGHGLAAGSSMTFSLPFAKSVVGTAPSTDPPVHGDRPDDRPADLHPLDQVRRRRTHHLDRDPRGGHGLDRHRHRHRDGCGDARTAVAAGLVGPGGRGTVASPYATALRRQSAPGRQVSVGSEGAGADGHRRLVIC